MWIDIIVIAVVLALAAGAGLYIYKQKKKGAKCIGCPYAKNCGGNCSQQKKA